MNKRTLIKHLQAFTNLKTLIRITLLLFLSFNPILSFANEAVGQEKALSTVTGKININAADATILSKTLKGVGIKKAIAIVEYRTTYGPFQGIQELSAVSGIGDATIKKNAHLIAIQ